MKPAVHQLWRIENKRWRLLAWDKNNEWFEAEDIDNHRAGIVTPEFLEDAMYVEFIPEDHP